MPELDLNALKGMVEQAADLTSEAREASERDRDYYDDHQWTAEEIAVLNQRRQPVITINRIKRKVDAMVGIEQRMRADPKAFPRSPQQEEMAEVATKALTFVDENTRFDMKRSQVFENTIVEGYGGVEVVVEERRGRLEIVLNRLRWEEILFDPHSREKDFSDAAYIGTQKWMTLDAAVEMLMPAWEASDPEADSEALVEMLEASMKNPQDGETYEDRPFESNAFRWSDRRHKRVRVAQVYYRSAGRWYLSIFCGGGLIYNQVSPYQDEDGKPTCPIMLMTAYIDRENRRYGVVRSMISPQDEINKRRSKILHQLNSRQTVGVKGAVDSVANMKRELAAPDGHVDINMEAYLDAAQAGMKPFDFVPVNDQTAGQFNLLQEAKNEIDMFGPNPSLIGQTTGDASGRAIMAQQQAGMAELAPLYDSLRDWTIRVYRAMWERIRQFWTEERWIRIAQVGQEAEWVGLNRQAGMAQTIDPQTGMPMIMPQIENAVAEMDVDIVVSDIPDTVTLQQEQFEQLARLAERGIPIPPEMLVKVSAVHDKDELLQMLQEQRQQAMQAQMAQMQAEQQRETMTAQARAQRDMAGAAKDAAAVQKTEAETMETVVDAQKTRAETIRLLRGY